MTMVKAILFDLDGTLIDSESFHFDCWNELLSTFEVKLDHNDYVRNYAGVSIAENAQRLLDVYRIDVSLQSLVRIREEIYLRKLASQKVELMPFALETLKFFYAAGFPMGLVTSSSRHEVDIILRGAGFSHFFKAIITRNDVSNFKPHPDPYESAARSMGFTKGEYVVFEDTLTGISSAKNAGLLCFGIQSQQDDLEKIKKTADKVFCTLAEAREFLVIKKFLIGSFDSDTSFS